MKAACMVSIRTGLGIMFITGAGAGSRRARPGRRRRVIFLASVLLWVAASGCTRFSPSAPSGPLTTVEQVRRLTREEAAAQPPVRLRGTLTYVDGQLEEFFLQDSTGGFRSDNISDSLLLDAGSFVELTGTATEGGLSPAGTAEQVRLIRSVVLPQAVRAGPRDLVSGKLQYRFIQMEGRVQSAAIDDSGRLVLMVDSESRAVKVLVRNDLGGVNYRAYPGAKVQVCGVLAANTDVTGAIRELRLYVHSARELTVVTPALPVAEGPREQSSLPTLTTVAEVHSLSEDQARLSYPVRLRAVVTFFAPMGRMLTVQDGTDGIYVWVGSAEIPPLRVGQLLEVEGFSGPGDFAPVVASPRIRVLGEQAMPEPLRMDTARLQSNPPDSRWLEASGTVSSIGSLNGLAAIGIRSEGRNLVVEVAYPGGLPQGLLYSRIRFQGVLSPIFNRRRQLLAVHVRVPGPKFIQVEAPPPSPLALRSIAQLRQFSPGAGLDEVSRIRGTVMLTHPTGPTYIRDATGGAEIENHVPSHLTIGDVVEATGFADTNMVSPVLRDAELVKVGHAAEPQAQLCTIPNLLEDRWDPRLVALDGFLVDTVTGGADRRLVLHAGGTLFNARMEGGRLPALRNGSLVRVTGVVSYDTPGRRLVPRGFTILLRSAADVTVLRDASWWTAERAIQLVGILAAMVLAGVAWVSILRRRVRLQTADLRESRQMLQLVLDHIPQRVFWKDRESRYLGCNKACAGDAGVPTPEAIVGKTDYELAWREDAEAYLADDRQVMESGQAKTDYEEPLTGPDGKHRWLHTSKAPLCGPRGEVIGVLGAFEDITNRKQAEERLQHYSARLAESNEELKRFTHIVSHDLRAPLLNLHGFAAELRSSLEVLRQPVERLLPNLPEPERAAVAQALEEGIPEALGFIENSVTRMDHLNSALLRLARVGHREFHLQELDTGELLRETLGTLAHQIESRKVELKIGPLPRIRSDRTAIEQIFGNLLDNALKYLDPGRAGQIEVSAEETAEGVVFQVRDNGRGIAEKDMDKVFAPFRRAGPQNVPGEGMGLAYVRALLQRLDGRIECHSQLGAGSTFSFTIPRAK